MGFPDSSVGKESTCNAGGPNLIPGLGRSSGEGIGYPPKYSWTSFVAQLVKNPPAMQETWVWSLGWEDLLEKGKGYPLQYSGLENSMDCIVRGVTKSQTRLTNFHFPFHALHPLIITSPHTRDMISLLYRKLDSEWLRDLLKVRTRIWFWNCSLPMPFVFWPGEFHGSYSPRGQKESDMTAWRPLYSTWQSMLYT